MTKMARKSLRMAFPCTRGLQTTSNGDQATQKQHFLTYKNQCFSIPHFNFVTAFSLYLEVCWSFVPFCSFRLFAVELNLLPFSIRLLHLSCLQMKTELPLPLCLSTIYPNLSRFKGERSLQALPICLNRFLSFDLILNHFLLSFSWLKISLPLLLLALASLSVTLACLSF